MHTVPKYLTARPLYVWPAPHIIKRLRQEKAETGKSLTRVVEECLAARYGIPLHAETYPAHEANSNILNDSAVVQSKR